MNGIQQKILTPSRSLSSFFFFYISISFFDQLFQKSFRTFQFVKATKFSGRFEYVFFCLCFMLCLKNVESIELHFICTYTVCYMQCISDEEIDCMNDCFLKWINSMDIELIAFSLTTILIFERVYKSHRKKLAPFPACQMTSHSKLMQPSINFK